MAFSKKLNFNITDNLCTKQGNSSFLGLKSRAVSNPEQVIMARVPYSKIRKLVLNEENKQMARNEI